VFSNKNVLTIIVCFFIGKFKGNKGKVTQVYRKKWAIHVEKISKNKLNGKTTSNNLLNYFKNILKDSSYFLLF